MIWIFITLGSITLAASLLGLATAWTARRRLAAWHGLAIALLVVAWVTEHTTLCGRLCLVAAIAAEGLGWWALRGGWRTDRPWTEGEPSAPPSSNRAKEQAERPSPPEPQPEVTAPIPAPVAEATPADREAYAPAPDNPATDSPAAPAVERVRDARTTTCVLLKSACAVAPAVVLASLRRCGRRDAALAPLAPDGASTAPGDGPSAIVTGDIKLVCNSVAVPLDRVRVAQALALRTGAARATEAGFEHLAHVAVTTTHRAGMPCDAVARLHHYAHAALTEFAPVAAAFWPEARLLAMPEELPGLLALAKDPAASMSTTCIQTRRFPLPAPNEGMVLLDSLGLSAFGLPDIQIITADPPSEAVTTALADLVERFFASGCTLEEGSRFETSDRAGWRVSLARSAFAPDRRVVQLAAESPAGPPPSGATEDSPAADCDSPG